MEAKVVEVMGELQKIAGSLGVEAMRLWPQIVGITFVKSVFYVALAAFLLVAAPIVAGVLSPKMWKAAKSMREDSEERMLTQMGSFIVWIVTVGIMVVAFSSIPENLPGVFYPEAQTVLDIAAKLKK